MIEKAALRESSLSGVKSRFIPRPKLSFREKLYLRLQSYAKIGSYLDYLGNPVDLYIGECKTHGKYTDQPHASLREIRCPKCEEDFLTKRRLLSWQQAMT